MKCGTTALFRFLATHYPQVRASRTKDTRFFVASALGGNWDRGLAWYAEMFPAGPGLRLEASTHYSKLPDYPGCAARIRSTLPEVRLIYLVRDPLYRTLSHVLHNLFVDREAFDINAVLRRPQPGNKYLAYSDYARQLAAYRAHFAPEQLLILDVVEHQPFPRARLERFLGLAAAPDDTRFEPANTTRANAASFASEAGRTLRLPADHVAAARELGMSENTLRSLIDASVDNARRFRALTGASIERWLQGWERYR